jgi:FtsP/CotA-like multicopper oxidase with cupredoxin domain
MEVPVLRGDRFDLTIEEVQINITGSRRMATAVNGLVPAPVLRFRQGDTVTIRVINRLTEPTSIHWHGLRLPAHMDGVPGLSFRGIDPGDSFTYRFPVRQSGTYWYHSHSGMQEQTGLYGPLILEPVTKEPYEYDRDYVLVLSDWTDEDPMTIVSNLKQQGDYYNHHQRTVGTFLSDVSRNGLGPTIEERLMWGRMRMSPTDIMDVTGATYTFLVNGQPPAANWTALFKTGERLRLRFINSASMSTFDVRIPGLSLKVVQADGGDVEPVQVDELRIGVAETYDVIVEPKIEQAYTVFAQAEDRSGYARATLAPRAGMSGLIPAMDPRPVRTLSDMGMASMTGMKMDGVDPKGLDGQPYVDNVAMHAERRLTEAGDGLDGNGRQVLTYAQLKALVPAAPARPAEREIEFHFTGNMQRWVWGFDGKKFSEAPPVHVSLGERVRFVVINDTMMEHPIHLHGYVFEVENGQDGRLPLKHTINVKPGERMSFVYTADTPGHWAFHCHLLYHMETGMFRTVIVA